MAKIELKRFTNVRVVMRIQAPHLVKFLDRFKEELLAKNCRVNSVDPASEAYCNHWASLWTRPDLLPEAMADALFAMEEQVSAANWPPLEAAVIGARYANLHLDTTCSPESLALQLWMWCPYRSGGNLEEVLSKIASGKKVWEEKQRVEGEKQAKALKAESEKAGTLDAAPSPAIPLPSDGRGESVKEGGAAKEPVKRRGAMLPVVKIDSDAALTKYFLPYQINWINAEDAIHALRKQAFALAEKSVRIGLTHADSFKNVRKRLRFANRDYLFAPRITRAR